MGLDGKRVVVIGGSSGIGHAVAVRAVGMGAEVYVAGRRADRLAELVAEAGGGTPVPTDITNEEDRRRLVATASANGPIDLVVYTVGTALLKPMRETTTEDWVSVLATNVAAANQVVAGLIEVLSPASVIAVMSSETVGQPRSGLGAYGASKAALEESMRGWRVEHPGLRVCSVAVGATVPTEFGAAFEMDRLVPVLEHWARHGLVQEQMMDADEVADTLLGILGSVLPHPGIGLEHLVLRSPSAVIASAAGFVEAAEELGGQ